MGCTLDCDDVVHTMFELDQSLINHSAYTATSQE